MNGFFTYILQGFGTSKKVSDWSLVCQDAADHSEDIECRPFELAVMLDNGHKAVCDDRNVNLYSHSIVSIAPEGRDSEMLLYPSEEIMRSFT